MFYRLLCFSGCLALAFISSNSASAQRYERTKEFIVTFRQGEKPTIAPRRVYTAKAKQRAKRYYSDLHRFTDYKILQKLPVDDNTYLLRIYSPARFSRHIPRLSHLIESAEPNLTASLQALPAGEESPQEAEANHAETPSPASNFTANNDPLDDNWALDAFYGTNARDAWDISTGSSSVIVALLGTGVDLNHEDLSPNLWKDPSSSFASIKESRDGYNAFNVSVRSPPADDHGIGSYVAGIIGAKGNNGKGISGVAWNVGLMPVKIARHIGGNTLQTDLAKTIEGIDYVIRKKRQGHNIVAIHSFFNFSADSSNSLRNKIIEAGNEGILFINSAGDEGANLNSISRVPATFNLSNQISVGSYFGIFNPSRSPHFSDADYSPFSNFGTQKVHLAAPGEVIRSTWINNGYQYYAGTLSSAAYVAGAAALAKSKNNALTAVQIKDLLLSKARVYSELSTRVITSGVLDINQALKSLRVLPPGDYDQDGDVDGQDYLVWQRSYGQTGANLPADGNKDGRVDAADYVIWRDNYGSTAS